MDMQFVQGIDGTDKEQAITKVIINLARDLGLKVVAEGVETARQMTFLSRRMCDEVQGYYYFRPLPEEEVEKVLRLQDNDSTISQ
jgi:EAL domain-containing protein (putative c-di-GMP-specific phosphodiesterase class I)